MADIQSDKAHAPAGETAGSRLAAKRAAKSAKKAASRGTTNPVEEVAKSVRVANAWIDAHGRKVWIALGAGVVAAVAALGISSLQAGKGREAGALLRTAVTTNQGIIVAPEETPPEDPILPTFTSVPFTIDGLVASGQLTRQLSRNFSAFGSYTIQRQTTQGIAASSNAFNGLSQIFGFGVTYSPGQMRLGR